MKGKTMTQQTRPVIGPRHSIIQTLRRNARRGYTGRQLADMFNGTVAVPRAERNIREYLALSLPKSRHGKQ
jgi:hypothetical protein